MHLIIIVKKAKIGDATERLPKKKPKSKTWTY